MKAKQGDRVRVRTIDMGSFDALVTEADGTIVRGTELYEVMRDDTREIELVFEDEIKEVL